MAPAQMRPIEDIEREIEALGDQVENGDLEVQQFPKRLAELNKELKAAREAMNEATQTQARRNAHLEMAFDQAAIELLGEKNAAAKRHAYHTFRGMSGKAIDDMFRDNPERYTKLMEGNLKQLSQFFVKEVGKEYVSEFGPPKGSKAPAAGDDKENAAMAQEAKEAVEDSNVGDSADDSTHVGQSTKSEDDYTQNEEEDKVVSKFVDSGDEYLGENGLTNEDLPTLAAVITRFQEAQGVPPEQRLLREVTPTTVAY